MRRRKGLGCNRVIANQEMPAEGSGANLKMLLHSRNAWDDGSDLGTGVALYLNRRHALYSDPTNGNSRKVLLPRKVAQAAAKKAWQNRDFSNWRDRVE
jgi:hypothetical protein